MKNTHKIISIVVLAAFIVTVMASCTKVKNFLRAKDARDRDPYYQAVNKWTRYKKVIEQLDTKAIVHATYRSKEFRKIYVDKLMWDFHLPEEEVQKRLDAEMEENEKYIDFFVTLYTVNKKENDFSPKKEIWKVYLRNNNGIRIEPLEIKQVIKKKRYLLTNMYPYMNSLNLPYTIRFEKSKDGVPFLTDDTTDITLEFKSYIAKMELNWRLDGTIPDSKD